MANFTIVDKAIIGGAPGTCWVTGAPVGNPERAVMFNRWINLEDPLGPIYLIEPVCKELGAAFGMIESAEYDRLHAECDCLSSDIEAISAERDALQVELADLKKVVERYYTPAVPEKPIAKAVKK